MRSDTTHTNVVEVMKGYWRFNFKRSGAEPKLNLY
jgi:hypothetical protein